MSIQRIGPDADKTTEERVRAYRNRRLAACDLYGLADVRAAMAETDVAAWDAYRQALRDVPEQAGFPADVVWPTEPE